MTGIMCHERRAMAFRDGGNQGVFFSCRPSHAQQLCTEGPVGSRGLRVKRNDFDACHEFGEHVQIVRDTLRTERPTVEFAQHDGTDCQVVGMGSYPILNGHDAFQRRHAHVGIEMIGHRLGKRDAGFVPIAIDLIEGLIQFWIIAPAAKGLFQVGEPIDANLDLDLDLRSVWQKNWFLKFDRGSVNFPFDSLCHNTSLLSNIIPYPSWLGKERCGMNQDSAGGVDPVNLRRAQDGSVHRNDRRGDFVGQEEGHRRAMLFVRLNQREQRHRLRHAAGR